MIKLQYQIYCPSSKTMSKVNNFIWFYEIWTWLRKIKFISTLIHLFLYKSREVNKQLNMISHIHWLITFLISLYLHLINHNFICSALSNKHTEELKILYSNSQYQTNCLLVSYYEQILSNTTVNSHIFLISNKSSISYKQFVHHFDDLYIPLKYLLLF